MARNTPIVADPDAPPITQILARFVATHPSRGWSDVVDHEAHRTFLNWAGCAVGAATHDAMRAALAGVQMLQPAPQATVLGRRDRVDMAGAALLNGISSHTFDFDDTHLKTIIHEHAIGSLQRPMSDVALEGKFKAQSEPILGAPRSAGLIAACGSLGRLASVRELTALATPAA
jgi:hypothetical protein